MAGTPEGGRKTAQTIKVRYGKDHYRKIGAEGGKISRGGGFASMAHAEVVAAGTKGGKTSRRYGPNQKKLDSPAEVNGVIDGISGPEPTEPKVKVAEQVKLERGWDKWLKKAGLK